MLLKRTSRNFSQLVKPSNKKGLFVPTSPVPLTFKTAKLPDWVSLGFLNLFLSDGMLSIDIKSFPPELDNFTLLEVIYEPDVLDENARENVYYVMVEAGKEQPLLEEYVSAYIDDVLPIQHYKTCEKSLQASIQFLKDAEDNKGSRFSLDGLPKHPSDVRLYSDLVYLYMEGMLKVEVPQPLKVDEQGYVSGIGIILQIPATDIENRLLSPEPDCQYCNLQFFADKGTLIYNDKEQKVHSVASKWVKLLTFMMERKTRCPWTKAVSWLKIKKRKSDSDGKKALESIIRESVNTHLGKLGFPRKLGLSEKNIVWKDVK